MAARLRADGLSGGHGQSTAFRDLDLEVDGGRILTLLGPNGAGKSTLLLTLSGLLVPKSGTIEVDGEPLRLGRPALTNRAGVVLVPDNRCLFTNLSIEENLKVAARRGGPSPKDMIDVFPALEVADDVIVLNHGTVVLRDRAEQLRQAPELLEEAYLGAAEDDGAAAPVSPS